MCLLGTTAGVIRVNGNLESWKMHVLLEILYVKIVSLPLKMVSFGNLLSPLYEDDEYYTFHPLENLLA